MSSMYISSKRNQLLAKLSIEQLVALRSKLHEELLHYGYETQTTKYLEDFDQDITERIIEEVKDKYFRSIFKSCEYKNKAGIECKELACDKHILNKKGILVQKKSAKKIIKFEDEDSE